MTRRNKDYSHIPFTWKSARGAVKSIKYSDIYSVRVHTNTTFTFVQKKGPDVKCDCYWSDGIADLLKPHNIPVTHDEEK